ncbi:LysR substrate-binding domain-containing protein [Pleionea sp. CnH1-48]|uniref:LysR substrate-binding domain-containing protein n=1 Tax=Pleionea sp. CnH1-48 TaxID=2954494 RepID=UPI0020980A5A|nr:LysR substrate-binding domain-containing protein [Pleionea sp. CnH1-48]MCO7223599.1 LysR substrate-binding domain-containing protein [Pleionea sp. CnH1-48]
MKLQQLKYIYEVARHDLNVSQTAESLYTSQPGISKQIRLLEDELGVQVFTRSGKHLTNITPAGVRILEVTTEILQLTKKIQDIANDYVCEDKGILRIATTHTFSRYLLPSLVEVFTRQYPDVRLHLHQGLNSHVDHMLDHGEIDLVIFGEKEEWFSDKVMAPCFLWHQCLVVPNDHPLTRESSVTLEKIAGMPLLAKLATDGRVTAIEKIFRENGLEPDFVISASDSEILKSYVRMGMGVGIIARMAYNPEEDQDLTLIEVDHLFPPLRSRIAFHRNFFFRKYVLDFICMLAPHLDRDLIQKIMRCRSPNEVNGLIPDIVLPER